MFSLDIEGIHYSELVHVRDFDWLMKALDKDVKTLCWTLQLVFKFHFVIFCLNVISQKSTLKLFFHLSSITLLYFETRPSPPSNIGKDCRERAISLSLSKWRVQWPHFIIYFIISIRTIFPFKETKHWQKSLAIV